jgi:dipeptide/tripeptide permease
MFKKPNQSAIINSAISVGGGVVGSVASNIVANQLLGGDVAQLATSQKRMLVQGGIAVVSVILAASVTGKDKVSVGAQGAFVGMAVTQTVNIIKDKMAEKKATNPNQAESAYNRILRTGLGLGCACDSATPTYTMPAYTMPALNYAGSTAPYVSAGYNAIESSKKLVFGQKKVTV